MNIYHPYDTLKDTEDCLHLKESDSRERLHFITLRVVPILLMLIVWYVLQQVATLIPMGWNYFLIAITLLFAFLLLIRTYTTEVKILKQKEVFLVLKTILGTKEIKIEMLQVEKLFMIRRKMKPGSVSFVIQTRSKKSFLLLSIPPIAVDEHQLKLVKERFEDLFAIPVEEKN